MDQVRGKFGHEAMVKGLALDEKDDPALTAEEFEAQEKFSIDRSRQLMPGVEAPADRSAAAGPAFHCARRALPFRRGESGRQSRNRRGNDG